ncbi:DoxX family protein [Microlunatus capsulatus]|uniref:Membrane protein YphA (DoxX/SURF4 family) n=1 Tax=Microlunatus capsulatus TaxID=99117 RepID=A0ABS4Z3P8_9ACTN|nr:DoxX family protein [Microlunatus capsulatus]MBP2415681.1 putative membrane protein YphA (DoxX/SURF4 family) [Microlunatus capsulatus]
MTLLRATARTLLASYFVASGFKSVRHPELLVDAAEPVTDKLVPFVKRYAPASVAGYVPEDAQTLVRINGALQLIGGLALATGKGRRLGAVVLAASLIPSTVAKHPFWSRTDAVEKAEDRSHFLKNVSLLGGVLLAARDTEGKPGLVYLAAKGGEHLARDTRRTTKRLGRRTGLTTSALSKNVSSLSDAAGDLAENVGKSSSQLADGALAGGAALVGAAVASTRKARKQASKQLKKTQAVAAKQLAEAREVAAKQAAIAKKEGAKRAEEVRKQQQKRSAEAVKQGRKTAKKLAKKAGKVKKNIQLGEN